MIAKFVVPAVFAVAATIYAAHADQRGAAYATVERWSEAFNSGDVEQIVGLYTSDALVLGTLSPDLTSTPEDLRAYFQAAAAAKLRVKSETIRLSPSHQTLLQSWDFTIFRGRARMVRQLSYPRASVSSSSKKTVFGGSPITTLPRDRSIPKKGRSKQSAYGFRHCDETADRRGPIQLQPTHTEAVPVAARTK